MISADVTIEGGKLAGIAITEEHESETGEMAQTAFDALIPRMIEAQSLAVDNISGATATSNAIRDLAAQAITAAGGDPAQWQTPGGKEIRYRQAGRLRRHCCWFGRIGNLILLRGGGIRRDGLRD